MPTASVSLRRPKDFLLGLIFAGIAVGVVIYSRQYEFGTARQIGPGYLPMVLGLLLGGFGAYLMVAGFFGDREPGEPLDVRPGILVLSSGALFGLLIRPAGLIVSILVLIVVSGLAYRSRNPVHLFIYAVAMAAGCVIVFPWLLGQQIPVIGSWIAK